MTEYKMQLEDWLDDLCVRFVINLPKEDLSSVERICFQVEEAQWFYEDFIRPLDPSLPSMSLRSFCLRIFQHCPLLSIFSQEHHMQAFEEFLTYKNRIPVRGAIMLNHAMDHAVLVKGWKKAAAWAFPRGKISKDEDDLDCAIREVYEETGFDIRVAGLVPNPAQAKYIEIPMKDQNIRLYVFRDVPMDTHFEPRTRNEISKIGWFKLSELPAFRKKNAPVVDQSEVARNANKFYMVAPFLIPLKKWVQQQKQADSRRIISNDSLHPQYNDDIQTEEEGFKSSVEAADARQSFSKPSQRLDTMEGATAALQQLLKIQPPTQGLQDPSATASQATIRNTGNDLLALLRGKPQADKPVSPSYGAPVQPESTFSSRQPFQGQRFPMDTQQSKYDMPINVAPPGVNTSSAPHLPNQPPNSYIAPQLPNPPAFNSHSVPQFPSQPTSNSYVAPPLPNQPASNPLLAPKPADAHKASLLDMFRSPSIPSAVPTQAQLPRTTVPEMPPSSTVNSQIHQIPITPATAPTPSAPQNVVPAAKPRAPKPEPESKTSGRIPRGDRRADTRPQPTEKSLPFRPTAVLARPAQGVTSQPSTPMVPTRVDSRTASPRRPDVHEMRRKPAQRQHTPPVSKTFAPQILKRPATIVAEQEAATKQFSGSPQQPAISLAAISPPITAALTAAVEGRKPSYTATAEQKNDLLSMFRGGEVRPTVTQQKADIRSLFKAPEQPKPTAPQQKKDLLSMIKAQEIKPPALEKKADLLSLLKSPDTKPMSPQQKSEIPPLNLKAERRPSTQDMKVDLLSKFQDSGRRPSSSSEQKADLLSMFKAPEMRKSASQQRAEAFSRFQAPERRPSSSADKRDLLSMFISQPQPPKPAAPEQHKANLLSLLGGNDLKPATDKQDMFSRYRSPETKVHAPAPEQHKANLLSLLSQPKPPVQEKRNDMFSMLNHQQTNTAAPDPQKAHLLSLLSSGPSPSAERRAPYPSSRGPEGTQQAPGPNYNLLALLKGDDNNKPNESFNARFGVQRGPGFGGENNVSGGSLPPFPSRRPSDNASAPGQDRGFLVNYLNGIGRGGI